VETQTTTSFLLYISVSAIALKVAALRVKGLTQLHHRPLFSWSSLPRPACERSLSPAGSTTGHKRIPPTYAWPGQLPGTRPLLPTPVLFTQHSSLPSFHPFLLSCVFYASVSAASPASKGSLLSFSPSHAPSEALLLSESQSSFVICSSIISFAHK